MKYTLEELTEEQIENLVIDVRKAKHCLYCSNNGVDIPMFKEQAQLPVLENDQAIGFVNAIGYKCHLCGEFIMDLDEINKVSKEYDTIVAEYRRGKNGY